MAVLVDTSVLLAYAFAKDAKHGAARDLILGLRQEVRHVAAPVLSELFYMTATRLNYAAAIRIFASTREAFQVQALTDLDMLRMQQIMTQYQDAEFDFADVAMMALSERLNITRISTFDRRDFMIYRPAHCLHFDLLP